LKKLTATQTKLLLIKCAHLIAAVAVIIFIAWYFGKQQNTAPTNENSSPTDNIVINNSPTDIHRGSFLPETIEHSNLQSGNVYLAEDIAAAQKLSATILAEESAVTTDIAYSDDISQIYETLYEETLPDDIIDDSIISPALTANQTNTIPYKPDFGNHPLICIVIDDMGINHRRTAEISTLNYPLTSSFLTYGNNINNQVTAAETAGHEIILHAPMEALGEVENAPDVLTTAMDTSTIKQNLNNMLTKVNHIKGINNHMGSKFTQNKPAMLAVMEVLKEHNLFFLDSRTSPLSVAAEAAAATKVKFATRHVFLDNNNDKEYILKQLNLAEQLAQKNGYSIAIGHPKSQTIAALKEWLPQLANKELELVHLSKIIDILSPQQ